MTANFWMIVSNAQNFRITQELGFTVQGLKLQQRRKLQRVGPGDRVLFYVSGVRRFTATATVTSSYFQEETPIWDPEGCASWPYRIQIKPEIALEDAQYMDANMLAPRLEYVKRWPPENWYMACQGNLHLLPKSDFILIEEEMKKLDLDFSEVGDAGLIHLTGMTKLEELLLDYTEVTAEGVAKLKKALPNCKIEWEDE